MDTVEQILDALDKKMDDKTELLQEFFISNLDFIDEVTPISGIKSFFACYFHTQKDDINTIMLRRYPCICDGCMEQGPHKCEKKKEVREFTNTKKQKESAKRGD